MDNEYRGFIKKLYAPQRKLLAESYRDMRRVNPAIARLVRRRIKAAELAYANSIFCNND